MVMDDIVIQHLYIHICIKIVTLLLLTLHKTYNVCIIHSWIIIKQILLVLLALVYFIIIM